MSIVSPTYRFAGLALGLAGAFFAAGEASAGRFCGDLVESGISEGKTQKEAVEAAQKWWSSRAGASGPGYENWDLAEQRALECSNKADGSFRCKASGRPCLPDGVLPDNVPKIEM